VELSVVRAHHRAVVANQLLAAVAEVPQHLLMEEAVLFSLRVLVGVGVLVREPASELGNVTLGAKSESMEATA
jgi:hypothetical protein